MDIAAKLFLTVLLSQTSLEPAVTWTFHVRSCSECVASQIALMERYYRDQDKIILYFNDEARDREALQHMQKQLETWKPGTKVHTENRAKYGVGWVFKDRFVSDGLIDLTFTACSRHH